eukprot:ANDGO_06877.mRNA.1 DNA topoisomerase 2
METAASSSSNSRVQILDHRVHILTRPDTYVGALTVKPVEAWVFDVNARCMVKHPNVQVSPALLKIFDEVLVNASDFAVQEPRVTEIRVTIDRNADSISVYNNGGCVELQPHHQRTHLYVPEVVFAEFMSSSNFEDNTARVVGGRNGYGAKLANVFSSKFSVDLCDGNTEYKQEWGNNMSEYTPPVLNPAPASQPSVCVTFIPDLGRMGLEHISDDLVSLFFRRVLDVSAYLHMIGRNVHVHFRSGSDGTWTHDVSCSDLLPTTQQYARAFFPDAVFLPIVANRLLVVFAIQPLGRELQQVSIVNGIFTSGGGEHVKMIIDGLWNNGVSDEVRKKCANANLTHFRQVMQVVVCCQLHNPEFSSQTKEELVKFLNLSELPVWNGGLAKQTVQKLVQNRFVESVTKAIIQKLKQDDIRFSNLRVGSALDVPKLQNAALAGTDQRRQCSLILTEGDSAMALVSNSLSTDQKRHFGVYPLRGKFLNVCEVSREDVLDNEEVKNIVKALNLSFDLVYDNDAELNTLHYGHVVLMTDQDHDGLHIKGLLLNFFQFFWPHLVVRIPDFLKELRTPIIRAVHSNGSDFQEFFALRQFRTWFEGLSEDEQRAWRVKYYKGLGTSTTEEGRRYFERPQDYERSFLFADTNRSMLDVFFSEKKAEERRKVLEECWKEQETVDAALLDVSISEIAAETITMDHFLQKEMVSSSLYDCIRSIPNVLDGLTPAQRKVLYTLLRHDGDGEDMRVSELIGMVVRQTKYHHGEASLGETIIGMAQSFVGSNNVPLLVPVGQFGSRLMGGQDAAKPRYIFTRLDPIAHILFPTDDLALLEYFSEEGQNVEPKVMLPIMPMILVNGARGIGTGFSTEVPNFHPGDLAQRLKAFLLDSGAPVEGEMDRYEKHFGTGWTPWYAGFTGEIVPVEGAACSWANFGRVKRDGPRTLQISELPVHAWVRPMFEQLQKWMVDRSSKNKVGPFQDAQNLSEENRVCLHIQFHNSEDVRDLMSRDVYKLMRLQGQVSFSNVHLFSTDGEGLRIRKFAHPCDILRAFVPARLELYRRRKQVILEQKRLEAVRLRSIVQYVENRALVQTVVLANLDGLDPSPDLEAAGLARVNGSFDYLLRDLNVASVRVAEVRVRASASEEACRALESRSAEEMWIPELDWFMQEWKARMPETVVEGAKVPRKLKTLQAPPVVKPPKTEKTVALGNTKERIASLFSKKQAGLRKRARKDMSSDEDDFEDDLGVPDMYD